MNQNDRDFINALAQGIREEHKSTLEHSGVKGMKWGQRRAIKKFDKLDRMSSGQGRYGKSDQKTINNFKEATKKQNQINSKYGNTASVGRTAKGMRKTTNNDASGYSASLDARSTAIKMVKREGERSGRIKDRIQIAKSQGNTKKAAKLKKQYDAHAAYRKALVKRSGKVLQNTNGTTKKIKSAVNAHAKAQSKFTGMNKTVNDRAISKNQRREAYKYIAAQALSR